LVIGSDFGFRISSFPRKRAFLYTPDDVRGRIDDIVKNPEKESLPRQAWSIGAEDRLVSVYCCSP